MLGGYVRVSSVSQKDNWSVDVQRNRVIEFAQRINEKYELYDEVKSARSLERPELNRLIRDIESGKITKVWVVEFSRLSRDVEDSAFLSKLFQKHKVELYVLDQFVDLSKSDTRFLYNINAAVNTKSSDDTSERVRRTKKEQKKAGAFVHSTLYGYSRKFSQDGKSIWYINEEEASVVRLIFKLYNSGVSLSKIAMKLNEDKAPQRRGKRWTAVTVTKLLQHPEYFGLTRGEDGVLIKSTVYQPLLNEEDYGRLTYQKQERKEPRERFRVAKHVLSGLIVCSGCGARFYPHRTRYKEELYERLAHKNETAENQACKQKPKYIDLEVVEDAIYRIYVNAFQRIDHVTKFLKYLKSEIYQTELQLEETRTKIEQEVALLEEQRKRLVDAVASGVLDIGDIKEKMNEIKEQKNAKEEHITALKEKLQLYDAEYLEISARYSENHLSQFEKANIEERRKMYQYAFRSIVIRGDKIFIAFKTGVRYNFSLKEKEIRWEKAEDLMNYLDMY